MQKTILITGSTDGIGLEAAKMLVSAGHRILLHGRNPAKLEMTEKMLSARPEGGLVDTTRQICHACPMSSSSLQLWRTCTPT